MHKDTLKKLEFIFFYYNFFIYYIADYEAYKAHQKIKLWIRANW